MDKTIRERCAELAEDIVTHQYMRECINWNKYGVVFTAILGLIFGILCLRTPPCMILEDVHGMPKDKRKIILISILFSVIITFFVVPMVSF